jgi:ankyrin repeat protein
VDCVACGVTPLREAVLAGKEDVVRCLLQAGADPGIERCCFLLLDTTQIAAYNLCFKKRVWLGVPTFAGLSP